MGEYKKGNQREFLCIPYKLVNKTEYRLIKRLTVFGPFAPGTSIRIPRSTMFESSIRMFIVTLSSYNTFVRDGWRIN